MSALIVIVLLVPFGLFCGVLFFALHRKGDLKAGASIGHSSFFISVRDKK